MKLKIAMAALASLAFSHFAAGQDAPAPPPAKIDAFAWLVGYWEGEGLGGRVEDVWLPPRGGVMLGAFRLTKPDGKGFYELFAIEEWQGSLRFVVKHFHTDWVGWEEKDQALKLPLKRLAAEGGVFGGVVLRREGADGLTVTLTIRAKDGSSRTEVLRYTRRAL
jgi:hypothetical protein